MYNHLWVTPNTTAERYPAGEYPFQHPGGDGLPTWTAADRPTTDTDVVLWHVFGTDHVPRAEDLARDADGTRTGFHLKPHGFFSHNPGLDVPATQSRLLTRIADTSGRELIGYTSRWSAEAGEALDLMVSTTEERFEVTLLRLRHGDPNPAGPGFLASTVKIQIAGLYPGASPAHRCGVARRDR